MVPPTTTPRQATLVEMASLAIQTRTPAILWGAPGVGKTSVVTAICKALDIHQETIISSLRDPTDFGGLPFLHEGAVHLATPAWAKRLKDIGESGLLAGGTGEIQSGLRPGGPSNPQTICGLAFFDEITCAPPAVQAALLRVILEGVVGDTKLPNNIAMLAAANPPDQAAGGWDLALPLMNRFMHIQWEISPLTWADGFSNGFPIQDELALLQPNWTDNIPAVKAQISQYIRNFSDQLLSLPKDNKNLAFPTPRSWDMLSRMLAATDSLDLDPTKFAGGIVGTGVGFQFLSWRQTRSYNLDATEAMKGNNDYTHQIGKANLDAVTAFTKGLIAHVVEQGPTTGKVTRAWHILFTVWLARNKAVDTVFNTAAKLVTTTPLKPKEAFGATPTGDQVEFLKQINAGLHNLIGLDLEA